MKRPQNKIIVTSIFLVAILGAVSSVTSSVAWFYYATTVKTAYTGTTINTTKLLSLSLDQGRAYAKQADSKTVQNNAVGGTSFVPLTTGPQSKDGPLETFYAQPNYQQGLYENWPLAKAENYATFTLLLKVDKVEEVYTPLTNDIYLTDLTIVDAITNGENKDLSDAVRVHFEVIGPETKYFLFAKNTTETSVGNYLDLNNDGEIDPQKGYEFEFENGIIPPCLYGGENLVQTSYLSTDENILAATDQYGDIISGTPIGTATEDPLRVVVTIWLEGWSNLSLSSNGVDGALPSWDSTEYGANTFHVGMEFGVKLYSEEDDI